jgi:hypothetical protein
VWGIGIGLCIGTGLGIALGAAQGDKHAKAAAAPSRRSGECDSNAQAKDA